MNANVSDSDAIVAIASAVLALGSLFLCYRAFAKKHYMISVIWLLCAAMGGALALFFASFTIRLM